MKKHILVVSQHFYPENFRINDICMEWIKRGYKVTVLTGIPNYPEGDFFKGYGWSKVRKEVFGGVDIIRIPILPRKNNKFMLSLNYISFVVAGWFWKISTKLKADIVFINQTSPMTQALPGIWYAKHRKIPVYIYVKDLWPESVQIITGIKSKGVLKPLERMVDRVYERCDRIFTSSCGFIDSIKERGVDSEKLVFWPQYAEDVYKHVDVKNAEVPEIDQKKFNLLFAGNFGQAQGLDVLPKAARILKQKGVNVMFNMLGDGRYKQEFIKQTAGVEEMFNFVERQPVQRVPEFMAVCDATLITLSKSEIFAKTIPAKTQSCLACGIPILVSADGEVSKIIENSGAGLSSRAENGKMLAKNIELVYNMSAEQRDAMAQKGLCFYQNNFNKEKLLAEMDEYLK